MANITGTFGKALTGAVSINFSTSGGDNCDDSCAMKGADCYAERTELRPDRGGLVAKLRRHEKMLAWKVCGAARYEIQGALLRGESIPWVRISTAGSLPQPEMVRGDTQFRAQFQALLQLCRDNGIPIHIPVESYPKARFYRALAGNLATIRESAQTADRFIRAAGAVSVVAGSTDDTRLQRIEKARVLAKRRRESTGRKTVVCPAILNSWAARRNKSLKNANAKCGACTACAESNVDIVYPLH